MQKIVTKIITITKYIKNSPKAKEKVGSYIENQNGQVLMIHLNVRTMWNSAYEMISKFIKLKCAIQQFLAFPKSVSWKKWRRFCVKSDVGNFLLMFLASS